MDIPPQSGIGPLCFFLLVGLSVKLYLNANFISLDELAELEAGSLAESVIAKALISSYRR